ncbi:MAG TPA: NADH-quinone oxidoreductase subunit C, partial [Acidimicrobiales bacterium]|nr:NADH-quinone oxidoreductase subunit C [Acidimicrobiales bacterium]
MSADAKVDPDATAATVTSGPLPPPGVPIARSGGGQEVVFPARTRYHEVMAAYRDGGFEMLSDLCGSDYLIHPGRALPDGVVPERFEVVVELLSLSTRRRIRLRVQVAESDPVIDSVFDLFAGAE